MKIFNNKAVFFNINKARKYQGGFSIMSAVFIVVVLSLIASYIVSLAALTASSGILSIQGTKAYFAAQSGLQWGIYKVAPSAASGGTPPYNCPSSPTTLTFTQGGLSGFTAVVTCSQTSYTEGGVTYNRFVIDSQGQYGIANSPDYAFRELFATVIQPGV